MDIQTNTAHADRAREQTSAPVFAAFSTTSMSWLIGIGPVDLAPTFTYSFWFGISDNTAFVQRVLVGLANESPNLWNPCCNCSLEFSESDWFGWLGGKIDLGIWENLTGRFGENTRDLPIWIESTQWRLRCSKFFSVS